MNLAVDGASKGFFSALRTLLANFTAGEETGELARLDRAMVDEIARDCGISTGDLLELAAAGPHAADEMMAMMRQLDIDPAEVALRYPQRFRSMQVDCGHCPSKETCRADLDHGTAAARFHDYCLNAEQMAALRAEPDMLRG